MRRLSTRVTCLPTTQRRLPTARRPPTPRSLARLHALRGLPAGLSRLADVRLPARLRPVR
ncbi:hypothetical protein [Amycolatopsis rifamycinica]|uniref:hypothetical protein n=1 Tax=Amycolatopsis rifamycinica TaxID=287986 RepID=UPI00126A72AA|nr:hypothetical protein [Amycolatopsis rifamycinica]